MKFKLLFPLILCMLIMVPSCELIDVTEDPINPNLSEDAVVGVPNSSVQWKGGLERQLALVLNEVVTLSEIASDNYENTQTFFNQFVDNLNIVKVDDDIDDTQFTIHRLRELAAFGLDKVGPGDENYSAETQAEFWFFKGYSHLLMGELFSAIPGEPSGPVLSAADHLNQAVSDFGESLKVGGDATTQVSATLARARAKYHLGDKAGAVSDANAAIGLDGAFLRQGQFDFVETPTNRMQNALYDRGTFDDLQPLPRLDFLDPKYSLIGGTQESSISILKIEEAHLILCEAAISDGNLGNAQTIMKNIIGLVATREMRSTDDGAEGRQEDPNIGTRPDASDITVAASAADGQRPGLVLTRNAGANVDIPAVSGTSVTDAMVDMVGSEDAALEMLYLMRQEIFMAEGRRMTDLGIRLVVSETEELRNENINDGDAATLKVVPSFIASVAEEMDAFTYDATARTCTITHNLNKILAQNKADSAVLPFH